MRIADGSEQVRASHSCSRRACPFLETVMQRKHPLGSHHSHYQARRLDGQFVSHDTTGGEASRDAVRSGQRLVVTPNGLRSVPA